MIVKRIYSIGQNDSVEEEIIVNKNNDKPYYKLNFQFNGEIEGMKKIFLVRVFCHNNCIYNVQHLSDVSGVVYYSEADIEIYGNNILRQTLLTGDFLQFLSETLKVYGFVDSTDNNKELLLSFAKYIDANHTDEYGQLCLFDESCEYGSSYEYAVEEFLSQLNKKDPV